MTGLYEAYNRYRWKRHFNGLRRRILESGEMPAPIRATLELTLRCNLNCRMCFRERGKANELDLDGIRRVVDNLGASIDEISLIGGEIFLRSDVFEVLDLLRDRGFVVNMHTNGTLLDAAKAHKLTSYGNLGRVGFSLDGMRERHDAIRGVDGAFDGAVEAMRALNGMPMAINTVVMDENLSDLKGIMRLAAQLGAREYRIEPEMFSSADEVRESSDLLGVPIDFFHAQIKENGYGYALKDFLSVSERLRDIAGENGMRFTIAPRTAEIDAKEFYDGSIREKRRLFCKHLLVPRITPQGQVVMCHLIKKPFGSVLEEPLDAIWRSEEFVDFRKRLLANNLAPICKRCCRLRSI